MSSPLRLVAFMRIDRFLLFLINLAVCCKGDLTLIHEVRGGHGNPWATWSYSLLPSTFPLTWDEAREACEVIPGSMLARVEDWEGEAALAEYLKTIHMKAPLWLANRQTLPEVLQDEQREMLPILTYVEGNVVDMNLELSDGGPVSIARGDLTVGGDVGVTLRCSIYILGVGIVHELCSSQSVSAALCIQKLSTERPLIHKCPPSIHHTWLLVNRQSETTTPDDTLVTVIGLQQCYNRQLGQTFCHLKNGWSKIICPHVDGRAKLFEHQKGKTNHKFHPGAGRGQLQHFHKSIYPSKLLSLSNDAGTYTAGTKDFMKMLTADNIRSKRNAHQTKHTLSEFIKEHREQDLLRLSPTREVRFLSRPEALNLDMIETIMQDFTKTKKRKNRIPQKGNKDDILYTERHPGGINITMMDPLQQDLITEEFVEVVKTTKASFLETGNKEQTSSVVSGIHNTNPSSSPEKIKKNIKNNEIVTNERTYQNRDIKKEKDESGPPKQMGVGPLIVKDSFPTTTIIEAAVAEEPMDESMVAEEPMDESMVAEEPMDELMVAEDPKDESRVAEMPMDDSKGPVDPTDIDVWENLISINETKYHSTIMFPEMPKSYTPDNALHGDLDIQRESANLTLDKNLDLQKNDDHVKQTALPKIMNVTEKNNFNAIHFPRDVEEEMDETASSYEEFLTTEEVLDTNTTETLDNQNTAIENEHFSANKKSGDHEAVSATIIEKQKRGEEDTRSSDQGKELLLTQIFKGLFG